MSVTLPETHYEVAAGDEDVIRVDFSGVLDDGEQLGGTAASVVSQSANVTVSGIVYNTDAYFDKLSKKTVAANQAVQIAFTAGIAGTAFIEFTVYTTGTFSRKWTRRVEFVVV